MNNQVIGPFIIEGNLINIWICLSTGSCLHAQQMFEEGGSKNVWLQQDREAPRYVCQEQRWTIFSKEDG